MSREAIIFTVGAWFGGGLVALVMSMAFMRMIANDRTIGKPRDATIENLRLEMSQTTADLQFELRRALDERDLWTVKASQLQHLLDN